jgi:F420-dependent oxidoreductase-like protein
VQVGLLIPQGWKGEYDGWDPADAWRRTTELVQHAEALGFESAWVFDHFTTVPDPTDEMTFESFTTLTAFATLTSRVRLGHMVICTGFRNPALTAKLASTIDVVSGGRFELGIGAGWKDDEWIAYGYGFPTTKERLARLGDDLEVITRMLGPGRATYAGEYARVDVAINVPKGIQDHIPVIVGGNGPNVTMRLAARFADELNLVFRPLEEIPGLMATARQRCEEIDRDPATLRLSMYIADPEVKEPGRRRVDTIGRLADMGLDRLVAFPTRYGATREVQEAFAEDVRAAGIELVAGGDAVSVGA